MKRKNIKNKLVSLLSLPLAVFLCLGVFLPTSCSSGEEPDLTEFSPNSQEKKDSKRDSNKDKKATPALDYKHWVQALKLVDDKGMVHYEKLKKTREKHLSKFMAQLAKLERKDYKKWTYNQQLAFWINVYNALCLRLIIDHYPIQSSAIRSLKYPKNSIRQISGAFSDFKYKVMNKKLSLDNVEHGIIRKHFNEPRIHMALVCAAMSCPPLRNEPYVGKKLDQQLDDQSRIFFSEKDNFKIDRQNNTVHLSSIFSWFGDDFKKKYSPDQKFKGHSEKIRALLNFATKYVDEKDEKYLLNEEYSIEYLDYDWTLNEQK